MSVKGVLCTRQTNRERRIADEQEKVYESSTASADRTGCRYAPVLCSLDTTGRRIQLFRGLHQAQQ